MKRTLAALVLGALAIFAVGCGTDPIERGVIKHKSYDDPDEWSQVATAGHEGGRCRRGCHPPRRVRAGRDGP